MKKTLKIFKKTFLMIINYLIYLVKIILEYSGRFAIKVMLLIINILIKIIAWPLKKMGWLEGKKHIVDYLEDRKTNLDFRDLEGQNIKAKIREIHKIEPIETAEEEILAKDLIELNRIQSAIIFRQEIVKDMENYNKDLLIMGGIVGTVVGSTNIVIEFISEWLGNRFAKADNFFLSLLLTIAIFVLLIGSFGILLTMLYFNKEEKKSQNRQIAILMLKEMIEDREEKLKQLKNIK